MHWSQHERSSLRQLSLKLWSAWLWYRMLLRLITYNKWMWRRNRNLRKASACRLKSAAVFL